MGSVDQSTHREAVASFASREGLAEAVKQMVSAGFALTDLSVLASHESLEIAGRLPGYEGTPAQSLLAGLTDEVPWLAPITVAGFVMFWAGPITAAVAALTAAGLSVVALEEFLSRLAANHHAGQFARDLKNGAALLWVEVKGEDAEARALSILRDAGGRLPHVNERSGAPAPIGQRGSATTTFTGDNERPRRAISG